MGAGLSGTNFRADGSTLVCGPQLHTFVTRTPKIVEPEPAPAVKQTSDGPNQPKSQPKRKYDEGYLALGFTAAVVGAEERPLCVLCLKPLAADSMRADKLKRHPETTHPNHVHKPLDFFQRKLAEYRQQEKL